MELGTFGVIMKFSLELEEEVCSFYENAAKNAKDSTLVTFFVKHQSRGESRIKTLKRIRRENTTEMILEPISGLDSDSFSLISTISENIDDGELRKIAAEIELILQKFYIAAAEKIDFLSEAAYSLELLAEENAEAIQLLAES